MADFEEELRRAGKKIGKEYVEPTQQYVKETFDMPADRLRQRVLNKFSGQSLPGSMFGTSPAEAPVPLSAAEMRAAQENQDNAAMMAADSMANLRNKERAMKMQMDKEDAMRAQSEAEFDPASYRDYNPGEMPSAQPRFNNLRAKMAAPQAAPMASPAEAGMIELSEDPEEQARQIAAARLGR